MYVPPQALRCIRDSCSEGNCSIDLTGRKKALHVLNLDCLSKVMRHKGRISDCAILWKEKELFAVVELKGGQSAIDAKRVVEQIQAGVRMVDDLAHDQHVADFYPILMYGGPDPTRTLRDRLIEFRGQKRHVIPMECGSLLTGIPGLERLH